MSLHKFFVLICLISLMPLPAVAVTGNALLDCAKQMEQPQVDSMSARDVIGAVLQQRDMRLLLDSGQLVFFAPLRIDSTDVHYGAVFIGHGRMQFQPPISMERQQLRRFLKSDSLNRSFTTMVLLFDTTIYYQLLSQAGQPVTMLDQAQSLADAEFKNLEDVEDRSYIFQTLTCLVQPNQEQLLVCAGAVKDAGTLLYAQLPYEREQVQLSKREVSLVYDHTYQTMCSYALEADESRGRYNGVDRFPLTTLHYDIDARLKNDGEMIATAKVSAVTAQQPTRIIPFDLDAEMEVDSILDAAGHPIAFARYKDRDFYYGLWLMPDTALRIGDTLAMTFYYSGDVAEKELGIYFVFAGASWYPRHGFRQVATFDIHLASQKGYVLIATGKLVDSTQEKGVLSTHWQITEPTPNVSFNVGQMDQFHFTAADQPAVDIYFSQDLHRMIGTELGAELVPLGKHMEQQVAGDIQNSIKLFQSLFGHIDCDNIVASEILTNYSEAYSGFVHLGYDTWISTDAWGFDRMLRAHETAHQWWGAGVGYQTYHDQWLSEGFASYSAFLYLQQVAGNEQFLDRLNDYRKTILFDRETEGAVALGWRNGNVKDEDQGYTVLYQKGAFVLHMLRNLMLDLPTMKEDAFFAMMKEFYVTYNHRDATTADFKQLVDKYAGQDMGWFFDEWVYNSYVPTYDCSYQTTPSGDGSYIVKFRIEQKDVPETFRMYLPVEVELDGGRKAYLRYLVDKPVIERELKLPGKPKGIHFNPFLSVLADVKQ